MRTPQRAPKNWDEVPIIFDLAYACCLFGYSYEAMVKRARRGSFPARFDGDEYRCEKEEVREWFNSLPRGNRNGKEVKDHAE